MEKLYKNKQWLTNQFEQGKSRLEIATLINVSDDTIEYWRKKFNIPKPNTRIGRYKIDENYFHNIDTEEKAYWLGFIMADGCVGKINANNEPYRFYLGLKSDDRDHLKKFKNCIQYEGPIKDKIIHDKRGFDSSISSLTINSIIFCRNLSYNNIHPNKTGFETIPDNVPKNLVKHFIRGYFDGDGSICKISKSQKYRIHLGSASETIIRQIQIYLKQHGININYYVDNNYRKPFYYLDCTSQNKCKAFCHLLFDEATIYLDRKFILISQFIYSQSAA